jgi:hypothetical protein
LEGVDLIISPLERGSHFKLVGHSKAQPGLDTEASPLEYLGGQI